MEYSRGTTITEVIVTDSPRWIIIRFEPVAGETLGEYRGLKCVKCDTIKEKNGALILGEFKCEGCGSVYSEGDTVVEDMFNIGGIIYY